jgi:hypothetical protein
MPINCRKACPNAATSKPGGADGWADHLDQRGAESSDRGWIIRISADFSRRLGGLIADAITGSYRGRQFYLNGRPINLIRQNDIAAPDLI